MGTLNITAYDGFVPSAAKQRFEAETGVNIRIRPAASQAPELTLLTAEREQPITDLCTVVWKYRLGNRNAVGWVLDQHKERKPKDPIIARDFDTYRLEDRREDVIELIGRVTRVSVATVAITEEMAKATR